MLKQKLIKKRKEKALSQGDIAFKLGIEQSQYSRRENGKIFIPTKEWIALAKILNTTVGEIYEPQDGVFIINNENNKVSEKSINVDSQIEYILEMKNQLIEVKKKYIEKLEEENNRLRKKIKHLEYKAD
ncbi:helix-turn-helix transcriptional regulator [Aequorivita sp. KMM 9714]|uniref:helix-turn-helix transcriptional regulator n=1 Tax=Aequorivita sp. KMM 9714 TaxID=2707173 RepID=UPI0013EA66C7|nr:helix-turn-helix transcriptional regulator [Aequorivita sp. KMM 9714]NGX83088.1 helix-turn-helix transcriptional regulator [Aequorivita sp. KMM 9714]